jgi:4-hydroxybenzoate polyprenyltransferase
MMRRFLLSALRFYVYGNFHIALGAAALSDVVSRLLCCPISIWLAIFIGCATFCLYNLQRIYASWKLSDFENQTTSRHDWVGRLRITMTTLTCIVLATGAILFFRHADLKQWWFILCLPCIVAVLYAFPLLPNKNRWLRLRDIPSIKVFLVALVWASVTVLWPMYAEMISVKQVTVNFYSILYNKEVWICFIIVTAYIFSITIPFDIRDYRIDGLQVKSMPVLFGIKGAITIAIANLLSIVVLSVYMLNAFPDTSYKWIALILFCIPTAIIIAFSTPKRHDYYFSLLIDGLLILLWIVIIIADHFDQLAIA